ncbi:hypothetical protein BJ085DRAFT_19878, partial [Dimargaris cristalligena]
SALTESDYHDVSTHTMESLLDYLEEFGESTSLPGFDVEYSSGVLTLELGEHGTYVINKQPPNKQIWLSSPLSGPKRFDYDTTEGKWFYSRDQTTLDGLLNQELSAVFNQAITIL